MIIEDLIKNGESQTVEFKERITAPQMLARIISAFSNTDGGTILIGIREPNIVVGIDPERFENTYQQAVQRVTGLAKTSSEIIELNNKKIGVIHVEKAVSPVGSSEGYFTRLGESDRALGPEQLKQLFAKEISINNAVDSLSLYRSSYHLTPASNRCLVYATLVRTSFGINFRPFLNML
ncbi:AlbA family DNA-binding domain-containing protein [Aeromonas hydrophila]|uniref:AlbA family DNA-binding domain-containing protein n=1 Tax=Aeromonas hydrophila TaxID=644 RepID=UPI002B4A8ACF|nr:ATP-binding protein [Aeromonas hydrophila]